MKKLSDFINPDTWKHNELLTLSRLPRMPSAVPLHAAAGLLNEGMGLDGCVTEAIFDIMCVNGSTFKAEAHLHCLHLSSE